MPVGAHGRRSPAAERLAFLLGSPRLFLFFNTRNVCVSQSPGLRSAIHSKTGLWLVCGCPSLRLLAGSRGFRTNTQTPWEARLSPGPDLGRPGGLNFLPGARQGPPSPAVTSLMGPVFNGTRQRPSVHQSCPEDPSLAPKCHKTPSTPRLRARFQQTGPFHSYSQNHRCSGAAFLVSGRHCAGALGAV